MDADGQGCHAVWQNRTERSPSAVAKMSLANGLVYIVSRERKGLSDYWYLTALDFRTGQAVFKQRYGTGFGYNVNYAPISLGPDGAAYVGVLGGLVRIADTPSG
jgi:outer membrane protein assembly factor BamB